MLALAGASPANDPTAVMTAAKDLAARGNPAGGLQSLDAFLTRAGPGLSAADAASLHLEAGRLAIAAGRPDPARIHIAAFTARANAFRPDPLLRARLLREAARVAEQLGDYQIEDSLLTEALADLAAGDPIQAADAANSLGTARLELLRLDGAAEALQRGLRLLEHRNAPPWLTVALLVNLVNAQVSTGRIEVARDTLSLAAAPAAADPVLQRQVALAQAQVSFWDNNLRAAEETLTKLILPTSDPRDILRGHAALLLATTRFNRGLMPEAADAIELAATIYRTALGEWHPLLGRVLHTMGTIDEALGDMKTARADFVLAEQVERRAFGDRSIQLQATEVELGWLDLQGGDLGNAERRAKAALNVFRSSGQQDRRQEGLATILVGLVAEQQSRFDEAIRSFQAGQALIRQARGDRSPDLGFSLVRVGRLLTRLGRYVAAEASLDQAVQLYEQTGAAASIRLAEALAARADLRARQGDRHGALENSGRSYAVLREREALGDQDPALSETFEHYGARSLFSAHARMLLTLRPNDDSGLAEAFQASQEAMNSRAGDAIRRTASRLAAGNGELAMLLRRWGNDLDALNAAQAQARGALAAEQSILTPEWGRLQTLISVRSDALRATETIIASRFPASAELIRPRPVDIRAVRKALAGDEAVLMPLVDDAGTMLWAITRDNAEAVLLQLNTDELGRLVQRVRRGVDNGAVREGEDLPDFDVAAAQTLYSDLIAPAKSTIGSRTNLVLIPDGALQTLPLHLLITDDQSREWVASRYAVEVAPSAGALVAGRSHIVDASAHPDFLGVGNPKVAPVANADGSRTKREALRDAIAGLSALPETEMELSRMTSLSDHGEVKLLSGNSAGKPPVPGATPESHVVVAADEVGTNRRRAALRDAIAGLSALPETEMELSRMASLFDHGEVKLLTGSSAGKVPVLAAMPESHGVVAFATHAVMAGQLPGVGEPAIVLSRGGGSLEDMLLTASEVAASHLDTTLAILSACNTASPDGGPFAEGLSGLARAFFHAGARTLLVSNWAVKSRATVELTTAFLQALESRPDMRPSQALQQAMKRMLKSGDPTLMDPAAWAPFIVVGQ